MVGPVQELVIKEGLCIPAEELEWQAIRAQGAGGQHVNKVSSAVHLRFDAANSSLPPAIKQRLLAKRDQRISKDGVIIIKAQQYRSQDRNREDALARLRELVLRATKVPKARKATRPSRAAKARRMDTKTRRGQTKSLRGKIRHD